MTKGYLAGWKRRKGPQEEQIIDYWFSPTPDRAATWATRLEAENECTSIFHFGIDVLAIGGGTYFCRNFVVEERAPGEFVVSCEAPFLLQNGSGQSGSESQDSSCGDVEEGRRNHK
jgi:hypothetical protein